MGFKITQKGNYNKVSVWLERCRKNAAKIDFKEYAEKCVDALSAATPVDSGLTASSWYYTIENTKSGVKISFLNSNIVKGVPIAIILQYGHGTRNGGWVEGRDYINPAIQPLFDEVVKHAWKEVTR